jgi:xanthine dehydrogenase accessory factor
MGQWDEDGVRAAVSLEPAYLGVVASRTRFAQIRDALLAGGSAPDPLARITNPAGVNIGAQLPEEIALSVLAEIVQRRRAAPSAPPPPALIEALDPICGMTVAIATARHTAEFGGRTFYFCCGGCRERFLREPERFATAATSEGGP